MSIIVTNEITVPAERAEAVAGRFKENSKNLEGLDGFEGFQVCRPTEPDDSRWLVITRWRDEASYAAWREGKKYAKSHPEDKEAAENRPLKGVDAQSVVRHYAIAHDYLP